MISKESIKKELANDVNEVKNGILTYSTDPEETEKLLDRYSDLIVLACELCDALND